MEDGESAVCLAYLYHLELDGYSLLRRVRHDKVEDQLSAWPCETVQQDEVFILVFGWSRVGMAKNIF